MDEILRNLAPGARVLDLGCRDGSFPRSHYPALRVVAVDLEPGKGGVQADAGRLPFPDACFDAVISNHSLEHMTELDRVLSEIGRVVRKEGAVYISVPDASTFSDRLYRWIYHGGGHVNPFVDADALAGRIARATELPLTAMRTLHASFLFLERRHFQPRPPRRMWLFANGDQNVVRMLSYAVRVADRFLGTRLSAYGWAFYFGHVGEEVSTAAWTNVCIHCGSATPAELLIVRSGGYACPACGTRNLFTSDRNKG